MNVVVFGTGYVGLVQAAVLADAGNFVVAVDVDAERIGRLSQGHVPIFEPGLQELVRANIASKRLSFATSDSATFKDVTVCFIAVGTPPRADGAADLGAVYDVSKTIALGVLEPAIVVIKSTVPVGTGDRVAAVIRDVLTRRNMTLAVEVVSNPEFLKEGAAVSDCTRPDRIVIGTASADAERVLRELYAPFNRNHDKFVVMDRRSAELTKYASNSMLATRISFMNEIAAIAERTGADIELVRRGIGSDPRIGHHFIYAGAGYGGSCFPKDLQALTVTAAEAGIDPILLRAVQARNDQQKLVLAQKVETYFAGEIAGKTIAVWGLSFKPNTDDVREAPSLSLIEALLSKGALVQAFDPQAMGSFRASFGERPGLAFASDMYEAARGADVLVVVTEWREFSAPNFQRVKALLRHPVIFDGRNLFDPASLRRLGLDYHGIGRGNLPLLG